MDVGKRKAWYLVALSIVLGVCIFSLGVSAPDAYADEPVKAERTIIYYCDGGSSEETGLACSDMLEEALAAEFDSSKIHFVVMTGGSLKWHLSSEYLRDENGDKTLGEISPDYNQIWELFGKQGNNPGYMKLLDGDGGTKYGSVCETSLSKNELMNDPDTLTGYINYAVENFPAKRYDLIMLDHGSGPGHGFGVDDHGTESKDMMDVREMRQAISQSDVVVNTNDGKFDLLFLECCMNGNFETLLALKDYTKYLVCSPDVDPFESVDYTQVLNYLNEDPSVDAKELGKKMVDIFSDYFEEHRDHASIGNTVQLTLVDTARFDESGILDHMRSIADTLRSEAGNYNYYDEIRSVRDDFHAAFPYLHDMGTLVEQLGINWKETDFQDPTLNNAYTADANAIQSIMRDQDIIYSRRTPYSKVSDVIFGRSDDGSLEPRFEKVASGGLNIFFAFKPTGDTTAEVVNYINAMGQLIDSLPEESEVRSFITTYRQAVIDYALIFEMGSAVSNIVDSDEYNGVVNRKTVEAYLSSEEVGKWDLVLQIIAASDREKKDAWIAGLIQHQKKEVLDSKNASVQKTDAGYLLTVTDTPKRVIGAPELRLIAKTPLTDEEAAYPPEMQALLHVDPMMAYAGVPADAQGDELTFEEYMNGSTSSYTVPLYDGQWYAVEDSHGVRHAASIVKDQSVAASFEFKDGTNSAGELYFDENGEAKYLAIAGDTKPIDLAVYSEPVTVTLMNNPDMPGGGQISEPFEVCGGNARLMAVPYADLGIEDVELQLFICDIYGVGHLIPIPDDNEEPAEPTEAPTPAQVTKPSTSVTTKTKSIKVRWKAVDGAEAYEVSWRKAGAKTWKTASATDTAHTIKGLKKAGLYDVRVRAKAGTKTGAWSPTVRRWIRGASKVKAAKGSKTGAIKVSWNKDTKATGGFKVRVYDKKGGKLVKAKNVKKGKRSVTIKGFKSGKAYYVRVTPLRKKSGKTYTGAQSGYRKVTAR